MSARSIAPFEARLGAATACACAIVSRRFVATLVKLLTRTDSPLTVIFWMLVVQSAAGFFPTLFVWSWPSAVVWGWMVVIAICGTFSHYCITNALRYADATIVVPMDFLRVPMTATAGWLIYSERIDLFTVLGAALILVGNLLNLRSGGVRAARAGA